MVLDDLDGGFNEKWVNVDLVCILLAMKNDECTWYTRF